MAVLVQLQKGGSRTLTELSNLDRVTVGLRLDRVTVGLRRSPLCSAAPWPATSTAPPAPTGLGARA